MARSSYRGPVTRQFGRRVLVACEGISERHYLADLRESLGLSKKRIPILTSKHSDPLSVIGTATGERDGLSEDWNEEEDQSWAVFDGDRADKERGNWAAALEMAEERRVIVAVTNPCIELWYLLHFQDQFAYISTDETLRQLRKHIPRYEKASRPFKNHLQLLTSQAIQRAKFIQLRAEKHGLKKYANPCSGVHSLVELLQSMAQ